MTPAARRRAERCLAVAARPTTRPEERAAAIGRAEAICASEGATLTDLAATPAPRAAFTFVESGAHLSVEAALRRVEEALARRSAEVGAGPGETVYDARLRNFADALDEARERDRLRALRGGL